MSLTLLGSSISPFVRKVHVTLLEKNLDFEVEEVSPFAPPDDFRKTSPLGKIPAFKHDDRVINDSSVICRYIDRLHPSPSIYPTDAYASAQAEWLEEYMDGGVIPVAGPSVFFNRVLKPMMGQEADEAEADRVVADVLPIHFDYLEQALGGETFFVGGTLTIADITIASGLVNLRLAGVLPDAKRWPNLNAFALRMHARESFETVIAPVKSSIGKLWV